MLFKMFFFNWKPEHEHPSYKVIKNTGMVKTAEEGFQRVLDDEEGTFAFIHDASEVRV